MNNLLIIGAKNILSHCPFNRNIFYLPVDTVIVVELDAQLPLGAALVEGAALRARIAQVDRR